jgi:hypothetical protein
VVEYRHHHDFTIFEVKRWWNQTISGEKVVEYRHHHDFTIFEVKRWWNRGIIPVTSSILFFAFLIFEIR